MGSSHVRTHGARTPISAGGTFATLPFVFLCIKYDKNTETNTDTTNKQILLLQNITFFFLFFNTFFFFIVFGSFIFISECNIIQWVVIRLFDNIFYIFYICCLCFFFNFFLLSFVIYLKILNCIMGYPEITLVANIG